MTGFVIQVASVPDRKRVVAEIWLGDRMVAEVRREPGEEACVQFYNAPPGQGSTDLPLSELVTALDFARKQVE